MSGSTVTAVVIAGVVIVLRGFSVFARRRQMRRRGMIYRDGWPGVMDAFREIGGGGHHGHHGGGAGGGGHHGGGHSGGGGGHHG